MELTQFLNDALIFIDAFFNSVNSGLKLFFNDLPAIFGLKLGWWFLLFGILGLIVDRLRG